jgi:hypothetical protein
MRAYEPEAKKALAAIGKSNPDFVAGSIAALAIKENFSAIASIALERAKEVLALV